MSRRKQAKPRALKPEEEEWNEDAAATARERKSTYSEGEEDDDDNDGVEANDLQDDGCNEENKADENEECNADETVEDGDEADPNETKEERYEREDVADVADIKSESMDSFESGDECKKKWKAIRDGYHRFKKKHQLGTGSAAPKHSKDKRHLLLSFLDSVPQHRSGGSNTPSSPRVLQGNEEDSVDDLLSSKEQEVFKDGEAYYGDQYSDNEDINKKGEVANEQKTNSDVNKKGLKEDLILKVWKDRDQKRQTLIRSIIKKKDDDIELFIRHIGEVLRNLPQLEKARAKKHLYAVLSDYEILAAENVSTSLGSNYNSDISTSLSEISNSSNSPGPRDSDQSRSRSVPHMPDSAIHVSDPAFQPGPSSAPHVSPADLTIEPRPRSAPHNLQYQYQLPGPVHYIQTDSYSPIYSPISNVAESPGPTDLSIQENQGNVINEEGFDYFNLP